MIRLMLIGAIGAGIFYFIAKLFKSPTGSWKEPAKLLIPLLALVLMLFIVTGKAHLLGIMLAGLVPFLKNIAPYLLQYGPKLYKQAQQQTSETAGSPPSPPSGNMSREEALEILGLQEGCSEEEIKAAHRHLMQKFHPDHGGNDYLATKLNQAKQRLMQR